MALPKWQKNGGRDFAFYHSHSGFEWDNVETTNQYQDMMCQDFQVRPGTALLLTMRLHAFSKLFKRPLCSR